MLLNFVEIIRNCPGKPDYAYADAVGAGLLAKAVCQPRKF